MNGATRVKTAGLRAVPLRKSAFLLLLLLLLMLQGTVPASAAPAARDARASRLESLIKDFDALCRDAKKGAMRDSWLSLEKGFKAVSDKGGGDVGARALFYYARSREELSDRSFSAGDTSEAAFRFGAMARKYSKHSLAPESKYRQAALLAGPRLNRDDEARKALKELAKKWPNSKAAAQGKVLTASLGEKDATAPPSRRAAGTKPDAKPDDDAPAAPPRRASARRGSEDVMDKLGLSVHTITIDAGHGGKDPGCMHNKLIEKDLTLAMAKAIGAGLERRGFKVVYTRTGNQYHALDVRTRKANEHKTDLFISLHYNASNDAGVHGLEIYYLNMAQSADAAKVAARENSVAKSNVSDLQFILTDFTLNSKLEESRDLAGEVRRGIMNRLKAGGVAYHDNGVRSAPFYVLMGTRMPAILVEFGYITNPGDAGKIAGKTLSRLQAEGLIDGIVAYRDKLARSTAGAR